MGHSRLSCHVPTMEISRNRTLRPASCEFDYRSLLSACKMRFVEPATVDIYPLVLFCVNHSEMVCTIESTGIGSPGHVRRAELEAHDLTTLLCSSRCHKKHPAEMSG
jgi:hypothetical protein